MRFAGAELCSHFAQIAPDAFCSRVRATEHASRDPFNVLERRHGLAEIVERGVGVVVASAPDKVALFYENIGYDWDYYDGDESDESDEIQNGIYWLLFGDKPAFDLKVDDEDDRVKLNRQMGFCCGEPVCGALYYANGVGESQQRRAPVPRLV